jgi:hypothetical protein
MAAIASITAIANTITAARLPGAVAGLPAAALDPPSAVSFAVNQPGGNDA